MIPFNKPFLTGKEAHYMYQAVYTGKLSGNGVFTKKCQHFFEEKYGFKKAIMTTSGTDALEMAAILCDVKPGDEVARKEGWLHGNVLLAGFGVGLSWGATMIKIK